MAVDAVIFDWGGTLTPWHEIDFDHIWRSYATTYDGDHDDLDGLVAELRRSEEAVWRRTRDEHRSATVDDVVRHAGLDVTGGRHRRAVAAYLEAWVPHTYTDPDVAPLFTRLRENGIAVGVLSNTLWSRETHHGWFERDGVLPLIDGAVYSSELEWAKPHPETFQAAIRAVGGTEPGRCVYVGDRLFEDVWGPQMAGMRSIHVPHSNIPAHQKGHTDGEPDAVIDRLPDLLPIVETWHG